MTGVLVSATVSELPGLQPYTLDASFSVQCWDKINTTRLA